MADFTASKASRQQYQLLSATYQSPNNNAFTHTQLLPAPTSSSPLDRTAYLGTLRKASSLMQEDINKNLTARMEEDKLREPSANSIKAKGKRAVDESKEEDNYGEEVPEED